MNKFVVWIALLSLLLAVPVNGGDGHENVAGPAQLVVPKNNKLTSLKQQTATGWKEWLVEGPVTAKTLVLEPGRYVFEARPPEVIGTLEGAFEIAEGQTYYVHLVSAPDLKHIVTWPSRFDRDTPEYERERLERLCTASSSKSPGSGLPSFPEYVFSACEQAAEAGSAMALTQLGYLYKTGTNEVPADLKKALEYLRASAAKNEPRGLYLLGVTQMYDLPPAEQKAGLESLRKASAVGFPFADGQLAVYWVDHAQNPKEFETARSHALAAVKNGDNLGLLAMTHVALKAKKFQPDFLEAAKWTTLLQLNADTDTYPIGGLLGKVESELTDKQLAQIKRQSGQHLRTSIGGNSTAICVTAHLHNPELKKGLLRIKLNRANLDWQDLSKPVFFDGLLAADRRHELRFYVDDSVTSLVELDAVATAASYRIEYDSKTMMERAVLAPAMDEAACLAAP